MILIVEDDLEIQMTLKDYLELKDYKVLQAFNKEEAINKLKQDIELVILDIQLPDGNGIDLCKRIREFSSIPIIFLTALLDEDTIVDALRNGGDDYVKKPFYMRELLARIESVSRRNMNSHTIKVKDLFIDLDKYLVKKDNKELEFTAIGYEILFLLVKSRGIVITRERIIEFIEERTGNYIEDNTVSVHMKRIREKLGTYNGKSYIETIRGIGYRWIER